MTQSALAYSTWHTDQAAEAAMADSHRPLWRHFIDAIPERDLSTRTVLDFGCNRGGLLRLLHAVRPFRRAIGVDIASDSIKAANEARGEMPLSYEVATDLGQWPETFDLALSYEVIYLLPDLKSHAEQMIAALRPGGVYYAVTGCHTENPLWPRWRELIGGSSNAPVQDYAPEDFIAAFVAAGFTVSVKFFGYDGFVSGTKDRKYYPSVMDALTYPARDKLLFRMEKRA